MTGRTRIIGVDPGSRFTGYGVIESAGNRLIHVDCGVIAPKTDLEFPDRIYFIFSKMLKLLEEFKPDAMAAENVFMSKNAASALKLGHARAASILAARHAGIQVFEYSALNIKSAVCGFGKAEKEQVQSMVKMLLNLKEIPQADAADALAAAICHANSEPFRNAAKECIAKK